MRVKILLWHGYLLGGTGSNVYTRALAREWTRAGHDVTVFSQEPQPELYDLGGAGVVRPDVGGLLPVFVLDRYEGYEVQARPGLHAGPSSTRWVEANAAALREHLPADLVFANHVLLGGPVGAATGARFAVKAHGSELEYSMRGNAELAAWGREALAQARGGLRRLRATSARCSRRSSATSTASTRCRPASTSTSGGRGRARRRSPACSRRRGSDPPNPGNANERLPDEGNAERLARVPRRRRADRRLLRQAPLQQGRPRPARGAARRSTRAP